MPRPPKPWYRRNGWYIDFGYRNRLLIIGPKNADTKLAAEKELLRLREEARLLDQNLAVDTPFAVVVVVVVERFLEAHEGRPVYADSRNQLLWFMGEGYSNGSPTKRGPHPVPFGAAKHSASKSRAVGGHRQVYKMKHLTFKSDPQPELPARLTCSTPYVR